MIATRTHPRGPAVGVRSAVVSGVALVLCLPAPAWASHGLAVIDLKQQNTDATTLCTGCTAKASSVQVTASSASGTCGATYWLDIEVRPTSAAFTGTPTHRSATINKTSCVVTPYPWTTLRSMTPSYYKWQARERVSTGSTGPWVAFVDGTLAFGVSGPPTQLSFSTAEQTLTAGTCSAVATVEVQDASGVRANVTSATALALSSTSGTTAFYADAGCTTATTSVIVAAGPPRRASISRTPRQGPRC